MSHERELLLAGLQHSFKTDLRVENPCLKYTIAGTFPVALSRMPESLLSKRDDAKIAHMIANEAGLNFHRKLIPTSQFNKELFAKLDFKILWVSTNGERKSKEVIGHTMGVVPMENKGDTYEIVDLLQNAPWVVMDAQRVCALVKTYHKLSETNIICYIFS